MAAIRITTRCFYTWSVTGGTLTGEGRAVSWNLSGVQPGTYTASVEVNDGNSHTAQQFNNSHRSRVHKLQASVSGQFPLAVRLTSIQGSPITLHRVHVRRHECYLQLVSFGRHHLQRSEARHRSRLTRPGWVVRRLLQRLSLAVWILPARGRHPAPPAFAPLFHRP